MNGRLPWVRSPVVAALLAVVAAPESAAETVLLKSGNEVGVGWLFLDSDGRCRIATPRHVIDTEDGEIMAPALLQRNGRTTATRNPVAVANPDVDLAFLDASPIVANDGCTDSRLTGTPLDALLASMDTGILNMITEVDQQTIRVELRAAAIDRFGGGVIAVMPVAGEENLKSGMSGSAILVNGAPLAMLFWVDPDGVGLAYRFDAIANYNSTTINPDPGSPHVSFVSARDIALIEGTLGGGSLNALRADGGYSEINYERRRVVLLVDLGSVVRIDGLRADAPSEHELGVDQMIIEADPGSGAFGYVRSCGGMISAPRMQCSFAPRQAERLRVTFVEPTVAPPARVLLNSLEILSPPGTE